ncbi:outer membrane protein, adhesin transport system [Maridesulfovibrio ferrireducens]|uniref:Outer membrane protein, adhesin transport system n=1 Tax=Maridesulfovibrio ferrireducens TaxID=246191 RepID=A0A1G9JNT9_9BACT|nr:TolC family protein [Maridesulfovibrio ferrireducens]SDL39179.1 outer membrane protein, adhesin transport system [Maridesulfovibrio ferrireducens]
MKFVRLPVMFAVFFLLFASVGEVFAQPAMSEGMTAMNPGQVDGKPYLAKILKDLLSTHDRIKAAEARVESAEHLVSQSWSGWTPKVDASVEGGREEIDKPGGGTNKGRNEEKIKATQLLYDFGGATGGVTRAEAVLNEYKAVLDQTKQELIIQGVDAYLGLIRSREMLKYAIQSEESMKRLSGMEETLVQRGAGLSYKELQIKAQLAGAMSYRVTVERQLQIARNRFRSVFGYPITSDEIDKMVPVAMPSGYMPASIDDAIAQAYEQNPQLLQLKYTKEASSSDVDIQEATLFPKFEFVVEGKRREQDQGASGVRMENKATFQVSYTGFSGISEYQGAQSAKANLREIRKQTLDVRRTVEENVRNAWLELMTLRKNAELYRTQANITAEFLELIKKKRATGEQVELLDILVGERDYSTATSASVTADIDNIIFAYRLLYQMGMIDIEVFE